MTILPDVFIVPPYMKVINRSANNETLPSSPGCIYHEYDKVYGLNGTPNGIDGD